MTQARSLARQYPYRADVPLMLLASTGLLIAGLTQPTMKLTKVIFFHDTYSIWRSIVELWRADHVALAAIVFLFSLVFPVVKLVGMTALWYMPLTSQRRREGARAIAMLGKWSMLDVFVVATLVVLIKAQDVADAQAQPGIYLFAASILLSIVVGIVIERKAERAARDAQPEAVADAAAPDP